MSDPRAEPTQQVERRDEPAVVPRPRPEDAAEVSYNFGEDPGALPPRDDPGPAGT